MSQLRNHNIILQKELIEDKKLDKTLRPRTLDEFIGQEKMKRGLRIFIKATKQRKEPLDHTLFHGAPGLGKTTLSHIIAHEMGVNIRVTSGPALKKIGDLAAILTNLENNDVLFIDEIHRISKVIEEVLYPAMEEYALDLILGKGPSAKTLRLDLPHFTLIGATTKPSLLSAPLRDRFGLTYQLNFYKTGEIEKIINRSANILNIKMDKEATSMLAKISRSTPRIANRLLRRVRDFAQIKNKKIINKDIVEQVSDLLDIDNYGLTYMDRKILKTLIEKFSGRPVGMKTLAISVGIDITTLEEIYEPYLIQIGFLNRTSRGRTVTDLAYQHLKHKKGLF